MEENLLEENEALNFLDSGEILAPLESLNEKVEEILSKESEKEIKEEQIRKEELKQQEEIKVTESKTIEEFIINNALPNELETWEEIDFFYKNSYYQNLNLLTEQQKELADEIEIIQENQSKINEDLANGIWMILIVILTLKLADSFFKQISRW